MKGLALFVRDPDLDLVEIVPIKAQNEEALRGGMGDKGTIQLDMGPGAGAAYGIATLLEPASKGQVRGCCLGPGGKSQGCQAGQGGPAIQGFNSRQRARASAGVA